MQAIAEASTPEEAKTVRDQLSLARIYAQRARKGFEIHPRSEMKLRAERESGSFCVISTSMAGTIEQVGIVLLEIKQLGIDYTQSRRWQGGGLSAGRGSRAVASAVQRRTETATSAALLWLAKNRNDFMDGSPVVTRHRVFRRSTSNLHIMLVRRARALPLEARRLAAGVAPTKTCEPLHPGCRTKKPFRRTCSTVR